MKKIITCFLITTVILSMTAYASTPKVSNSSKTSKKTKIVLQKPTTLKYKVKVDGKLLDMGNQQIYKIGKQVMVPLNITAKALGITVTRDDKNKTITVDNGTMKSNLVIGEDLYCAYSSKAIGMTTPQKLGVAPTIIEKSTYVPAEFYKILLTDSRAVTIKGSVINILSQASNAAGMPNPLVEYNTLDEARKAVGFEFGIPSVLPDGYKTDKFIVISNDLAEIFLIKDSNKILYRTAKGKNDISGDYNTYTKVNTIKHDNVEITTKGSENAIKLATWSKEDISYSLSFDEAVSEKVLLSIFDSIK
jgi:hypothetical protein